MPNHISKTLNMGLAESAYSLTIMHIPMHHFKYYKVSIQDQLVMIPSSRHTCTKISAFHAILVSMFLGSIINFHG